MEEIKLKYEIWRITSDRGNKNPLSGKSGGPLRWRLGWVLTADEYIKKTEESEELHRGLDLGSLAGWMVSRVLKHPVCFISEGQQCKKNSQQQRWDLTKCYNYWICHISERPMGLFQTADECRCYRPDILYLLFSSPYQLHIYRILLENINVYFNVICKQQIIYLISTVLVLKKEVAVMRERWFIVRFEDGVSFS